MIELIRSKGFWVIIGVGSLLCAVSALIYLNSISDPEQTAYICPAEGFAERVPGLFKIDDAEDIRKYMDLVNRSTNTSDFDFGVIEVGRQVFVLDSNPELEITRVKAKYKKRTLSGTYETVIWVSNVFLQKQNCNETSL